MDTPTETRNPETELPWRSRIVGHDVVDPSSLVPHASNWRKHPKGQRTALAGVLTDVGWVQDVIVNRRTGRLIDGHLRRDLAIERGEKSVPVVYVDLDEAEESLILATLDPIGAMAESDKARLAELMQGITEYNANLGDLIESMRAAAGLAVEAVETATPEPPDEATTKRGDLIILGRHRLLCGDSGSAEDLDRLLDGAVIDLVNTDPPYNVKVEPRSFRAISAGMGTPALGQLKDGQFHHQGFDAGRNPEILKASQKLRPRDRQLENDFVSDEKFAELLDAWFGNMHRALKPGGAFYVWGGYANIGNYPPAFVRAQLYFSQAIIWVKEHPVLTRKDFLGNHEWCFYGWKEGAGHYFAPEINNATDVWSVKKVNPQSMVHLTEKPVELAARAIRYSSRVGENVLDLFGGSGSTLMAAEQQGRTAFLMELDELYCDVIAKRFQEATGIEPVRIPAGGSSS